MHGFLGGTGYGRHQRQNGTGIEPLADGLGSRNVYGSPFRDINHDTAPTDDTRRM